MVLGHPFDTVKVSLGEAPKEGKMSPEADIRERAGPGSRRLSLPLPSCWGPAQRAQGMSRLDACLPACSVLPVQVRLQTQTTYRGIVDCMVKTYCHESVGGLCCWVCGWEASGRLGPASFSPRRALSPGREKEDPSLGPPGDGLSSSFMPPKVELRPSPALASLHLSVARLGSGFQPEEAVPGLERAKGRLPEPLAPCLCSSWASSRG